MMDYAARVAQADTYPKMLRLNAREFGGEIALREKDLGLWKPFTWNDYHTRVRDFALGMFALGLVRGDVVGIIGDNRPDWVAAEIASSSSPKTKNRLTNYWGSPTAHRRSSTSSIPTRGACGSMTTHA